MKKSSLYRSPYGRDVLLDVFIRFNTQNLWRYQLLVLWVLLQAFQEISSNPKCRAEVIAINFMVSFLVVCVITGMTAGFEGTS